MLDMLKRLVGYPDDSNTSAIHVPAESFQIPWLAQLPGSVVFVDTETTGLTSEDRIVTFGAVRLHTTGMAAGEFRLKIMHLIFNPEKQSHPRAEAVHGYNSLILGNQDPFETYAQQIHEFIHSADLVAAHNADFDLRFIDKEFSRVGLEPVAGPTYCTMSTYREISQGKASLDAVCARIGLRRKGTQHGAIEDAWLAMNVYLWLNDCPHQAQLPDDFDYTPANFRR